MFLIPSDPPCSWAEFDQWYHQSHQSQVNCSKEKIAATYCFSVFQVDSFTVWQVKEAHNKFLRTVDYYLTKDAVKQSALKLLMSLLL